MEVKNKKDISLRTIFLRYLVSVGLALILSILVAIYLLNFSYSNSYIIPSNYTENILLKNRNKIENSYTFDENLLPKNTKYLFISKDDRTIKTNMDKTERMDAMRYHGGGQKYIGSTAFMEFAREDGTIIITYNLKPYYRNEWMNKNLPSVNFLFYFIIILFSLLNCLFVTLVWSKILANNLKPILEASNRIGNKDLDFEVKKTIVKEFNEILLSLDNMKTALSESLKKQWAMEEERKTQVAALTHDLKTPISIVVGNAQLLKETELNKEQTEYLSYIMKNIKKITSYTQKLIVVNKTNKLDEANFEIIQSNLLADKIIKFVNEIVYLNNRRLIVDVNTREARMKLDLSLIERAIANIINNSIEYSLDESDIYLNIAENENFFEIEIENEGRAFTKEELIHAKDLFYQGDKSRNSTTNHGLGLYISDQIVRLHGGELILRNRSDTEGANILIKLPLC